MSNEMRLLEQNFVLLSGYLAADPDFRMTSSNRGVCKFRIGVGRRYKDLKTGDWKDDTTWVRIEVWGEAADRLKDRLKKGSPVHVEGRLKYYEYEDKAGQKRNGLDVIARRVQLLSKGAGTNGGGTNGASKTSSEPDLEEVPF